MWFYDEAELCERHTEACIETEKLSWDFPEKAPSLILNLRSVAQMGIWFGL